VAAQEGLRERFTVSTVPERPEPDQGVWGRLESKLVNTGAYVRSHTVRAVLLNQRVCASTLELVKQTLVHILKISMLSEHIIQPNGSMCTA
jgi:hypothetical protein